MKRRLFSILIPAAALLCAAGPKTPVTLDFKDADATAVLAEIRRQSGLNIVYRTDDSRRWPAVTIKVSGKNADEAIRQFAKTVNAGFSIQDNIVTLYEKGASPSFTATGTVRDEEGEPLPGATVTVKGTSKGTVTDAGGRFSLPGVEKGEMLYVSFIGMKPLEFPASAKETAVTLHTDAKELGEVVVNGIFERKKESFTGATTVIKKEQLMGSGNQNLLTSLRNIDPSFKITENIDMGSNPNAMPDIQLRGQQSMPDLKGTYNGNPNQPLFILDGFETDIATVFDLDMNRVETVVILKDAAAKAVYGSKAANGVVVIETHKPQPGTFKVTYKGDLNVTAPDLTGYNLCNAAEKLEVDRLHGNYFDPLFWEKYLNSLQEQVSRGVDTDWLSKPLRTGIGQRHSLYLEGGDNRVRYAVDLLYNDNKGIMKGSSRETFTGGFTLSYRYRNLLFRDKFTTSVNRADDSPYGSFWEYVQLNPYWTPYDETGRLKQIAGSTGGGGLVGTTCGNPLWNASIGTENYSRYTTLTNNFYIEWSPLKSLKFTGRLGIGRTHSGRDDFYPATHTRFMGYTDEKLFERGSYSQGKATQNNVSADITANWSVAARGHQLFLNAGWSIDQSKYENSTFNVIGFPNEKNDLISAGLKPNPDNPYSGSESTVRAVSALGALNYSYDDRYLLDMSYRAGASSLFGKNNRWGHFWSGGIGWNVNKERFLRDAAWLGQMKLRASTGYTGAQNFSPYQSLAMFSYFQSQSYDNRIGSFLMSLPNDDLKWQKTFDFNVGADIALFDRVFMTVDWYVQKTSDQLLSLTIPPSMGFLNYMENLGSTENRGYELKVNGRIFYLPEKDTYLNAYFSMAHNENKLTKISNALKNHNDETDGEIMSGTVNKPKLRFVEGQSMNSIWAVRSLGIDPATGTELFLDKDGNPTTEWNAVDQVVCGDTQPKLTGTFGVNLKWKGVFLNASFYYTLGAQIYNQTLVDRVENCNISLNVDKRLFHSVWKKPGDTVDFAYNRYSLTKPTSRFIQDLDELRFTSVNAGYEFNKAPWLKRVSIEQLRISFYMDDLLRLSTVRLERGLTYPYAHTYSLSVQATF